MLLQHQFFLKLKLRVGFKITDYMTMAITISKPGVIKLSGMFSEFQFSVFAAIEEEVFRIRSVDFLLRWIPVRSL